MFHDYKHFKTVVKASRCVEGMQSSFSAIYKQKKNIITVNKNYTWNQKQVVLHMRIISH